MKLYDARKALFDALGAASRDTRDLVDVLLEDPDRIYRNDQLPHGYKVIIRIQPEPDPVTILGITLEIGRAYDWVIRNHRRSGQTNLRGYKFQSAGYGYIQTSKATNDQYGWGARRGFAIGDVISVTPSG